MELCFLQAECGDAAYLVYQGNDSKMHHVLVDSGYERTYRHVLSDVIDSAPMIDLWVVSHIHDDHIGGAIAYARAVLRGEFADKVEQWCYNHPRPAVLAVTGEGGSAVSKAASIGQGDELTAYLLSRNKLPQADVVNTLKAMNLYGLQFHWLSPSPRKLKKLRDKYTDASVPLEKDEWSKVSAAKAASGNDYYLKIEDFDLSGWKQDTNIDNGSSVAFLTDLNGFRVLWLTDAHPRVLVKALKNMGHTPLKRLRCDYVKVTHHGSKGNNSDALYSLIDCRHYVISADGENRHYLPSKESIARILRNGQRNIKADRYYFYFTYDNSTLRRIFQVDGEEGLAVWNFEVNYIPLGKKWLQLQPSPAG